MPDANLRQTDLVVSESVLYRNLNFEKYNPNDLVSYKGPGIFRKMMKDDQVKAAIFFRRDAVVARDYFFDMPYDDIDEDERKRRIDIMSTMVSKMKTTFTQSLRGILTSLQYGFSLSEKSFHQFDFDGAAYWGLRKLIVKPFDSFTFGTDEFGNIDRVVQNIDGSRFNYDVGEFVHHVNQPDVDEHYGQSELTSCYRDWFSKDVTIKFRNIWSEQHAAGHRWMVPAKGKPLTANSPKWTVLQNILRNKTSGTGFILPEGVEYHVEWPANNVNFRDTIQDCNLGIARSLLIPNQLGISEQGPNGSRALAGEQMESLFWSLEVAAQDLADILNRQAFREVCEANWADGRHPVFKFKPVSERRKHELLEVWAGLVDKRTVKATSKDEKYIRESLEFPQRTSEDEDSMNTLDSMEPQQIQSLLGVIEAVKSASMSSETAVLIIIHTLPLDRGQAEELVNSIEVNADGDSNVPPGDEPGGDSGDVGQSGNSGDQPGNEPTDAESAGKEETIMGAGTVSIAHKKRVMAQAAKRVAFAVIAQQSESIEDLAAMKLSQIIASALKDISSDIVEKKIGTKEGGLSDVNQIKIPSPLKTKLRQAARDFLGSGWNMGIKHAEDEVNKAKRKFEKISYERLGDEAELLIESRSFNIAGRLSDESASLIKNIVLQGFKASKTVEQIIADIYETFARKGMITVEQAEDALGEALAPLPSQQLPKPLALLKTTVRTGLFEAINEARYNYFTDVDIGDFVEALEYTAVLDSRTTQICRELDGNVYPSDSEFWDGQYRPPNHFNCRSLLIPVTVDDVWDESPPPQIEPQEGFK